MEAPAPVGLLETELATLIAADIWLCKRAVMIENSIFAQGCLDHAEAMDVDNSQVAEALAEGKTWTAQAHSLSLLNTCEGRISGRVDKNMAQLTEMQTRRRDLYAQAHNEAIRLVQLSEAAGEVYESGGDFEPARDHGQFVYSASEIARAVTAARASTWSGKSPTTPIVSKKPHKNCEFNRKTVERTTRIQHLSPRFAYASNSRSYSGLISALSGPPR